MWQIGYQIEYMKAKKHARTQHHFKSRPCKTDHVDKAEHQYPESLTPRVAETESPTKKQPRRTAFEFVCLRC